MLLRTPARPLIRTALLDATLLAVVACMPALAHLLAFPIYQFEPMRIALFVGLVGSSRVNAYALALTMPLIAYLASGHPVPPKLFLIQAEMAVNVWAFHFVMRRAGSMPAGFAMAAAISVVASKIGYYALKYFAIRLGLLEGALVTTAWQHQAAVLLLVTVVGQIVWLARRRPQ
jgi:hypothetical protein